MENSTQLQLTVQTAIMYYQDGLTQQQIAAKLGITRQTVSKLLGEAKCRGIVEIKINNPLKEIDSLSEILEKEFHLKKAIVVPNSFEDGDLIRSTLAQTASDYTEKALLSGYKNIAFSWGRTMYETIAQMQYADASDVTVFPLLGATDRTPPYYMLNEMVRVAADKLGATPIFAYVPASPESAEDREVYMKTSSYRNMQSLWSRIDVAVVGIGVSMQKESGLRERYPGEKRLSGESTVGDICTHYFDINGKFVHTDEAEMLCASEKNLEAAKRVIAVAGGTNKAEAVLGALRTGLITDMITDELCCKKLMQIMKKQ